ncbi:MAG: tetratricopeptide repeat protein [Candidatus Omnitrophica bacterium]|nr:tetratricopeptide repeat protein [Candidatus Omnitrophota bacterium]
MKANSITACILLVLLGITVAIYSTAVNGEFVYDDNFFVEGNAYIENLHNIGEFFVNKFTVSATGHYLWRPLRTLSFAVDYCLGGGKPFLFHLTNIILHCLNILLVFWIARLLYRSCYPSTVAKRGWVSAQNAFALLSAALWGLHPVHTETVCWISCRGDLLFSFWILLGFLCAYYTVSGGYFDKTFYTLSLVCFIGGLLSKETAMVFPLLLIVFLGTVARTDTLSKKRELLFFLFPFFVVLFLHVIFRKHVVGLITAGQYWGTSSVTLPLTIMRLLLNHMRILFIPLQLRLFYAIPVVHSVTDAAFFVSYLTIAVIAIVLVRSARRLKTIPFGAAWFLIFLIPALNFFNGDTAIIAEHHIYLSSIGWALIIADAVMALMLRFSSKRYVTGGIIAGCAVLLALYAVLVRLHSLVWRTRKDVWMNELVYNPDNVKALGAVGGVYHREGKLKEAFEFYRKAIAIKPDDVMARIGLADIALKTGRMDEALQQARRSVEIDPNSADAYWSLGRVYLARKELPEAEEAFKRALAIYPGMTDYYLDLGTLYDQEGRLDEAIAVYQAILAINWRDAKVHNNLGIAYHKKGNRERAIFHWQESLRINPHQETALANISRCVAE